MPVFLAIIFVFACFSSAEDVLNETVPANDSVIPVATAPSNEGLGVAMTSFVPTDFKKGDIQFSIQVQNNDAAEIRNIMAFVTGKGFSTYNMVPIDSLKPGEKSYIIIMGTANEEGTITLTIKVNNQVFYQNITVLDSLASENQAKLSQIQAAEKAREAKLNLLAPQLEDLKSKLKALEAEYKAKEAENYNLKDVKLDELRTYAKNAQASIIQKDVEEAEVALTLGTEEYNNQKANLDSAGKIKGAWIKWLKDNLGLVAGIATSVIILIGAYETLKKKSAPLTSKMKEKVTKTVTTIKERSVEAKKKKKSKPKKK